MEWVGVLVSWRRVGEVEEGDDAVGKVVGRKEGVGGGEAVDAN